MRLNYLEKHMNELSAFIVKAHTILEKDGRDIDSAANARRAVELLCNGIIFKSNIQLPEHLSLAKIISDLFDNGKIPRKIKGQLHAIRETGNEANHPGENQEEGLGSHDLKLCVETLDIVCRWYITKYHRIGIPKPLKKYLRPKFKLAVSRKTIMTFVVALLLIVTLSIKFISFDKSVSTEILNNVDLSNLAAIIPIAHLNLTDTSPKAVFTDQSEYCFAANEDLINLIQDLKTRYFDGQSHRGVTCISAPAGVGKSTLLRMLRRSGHLPDELTYTIVLEDIQQRFGAELISELSVSSGFDFVFSRLPSFVDNNAPSLISLFAGYNIDLENSFRPFLIIDSIDEIHPTSAKLLLENIQSDIEEFHFSEFIHLFVVGRADGFRDFFTSPHGEITVPPPLPMHVPKYLSTSDMRVGVETSARYFHRESAIGPTMALIEQYDFIEESCFIQSLRGEIVKRAERYIVESVPAAMIKDDLFEYMIERNRLTHNRPGLELSAYIAALESIAIKYAEITDPLTGYFAVGPLDNIPISITIDGEVRVGEIAVLDILCRSGFIDISPLDVTKTKFRFYPSWIHEYLAKRSTHDL